MLKPIRTFVPAMKPIQPKPPAAKPDGMSQAQTILQARMERRPAPPVYRPVVQPVTQPRMGLPPRTPALPINFNRMPVQQPSRNLNRITVVQRQVSQEQIDKFLKGKKLGKFADPGSVTQEIAKQKYAPDVQQYMPNFDQDNQEDMSALQGRAKALLKQQKKNPTRVPGLPPSLETQVYSPSTYYSEKKIRQGQKTHIARSEEIESKLVEIRDDNDAKNVTAYLYIDDILTQLREPNTRVNPFGKPFDPDSLEITTSEHDAEALLLHKVLETYRKHFQTSQYDEDQYSYQLALVGPHGACDGCKDRLRLFKQQWQQLMQTALGPRTLVITYFYTHGSSQQRKNTTRYGWNEELYTSFTFTPEKTREDRKNKKKSGGPKNLTYYYRSMNVQTPGNPG